MPNPEKPQQHNISDSELAELQKQKLLLELEEVRERVEEKSQARELALRSRKENAIFQERGRQLLLARQNSCLHRKPNGFTAIMGQKNHQNTYNFVCLYCNKEFTEKNIPAGLMPDSALVGGPQI